MNRSHFNHLALAIGAQLVLCLGFWPLIGFAPALMLGTGIGIGFYWGREVTDAEIHQKEDVWWRGFDVRRWDLDSRLDLAFPLVGCSLVAVLGMIVF